MAAESGPYRNLALNVDRAQDTPSDTLSLAMWGERHMAASLSRRDAVPQCSAVGQWLLDVSAVCNFVDMRRRICR
jgi:hypothetical protein